MYAYIYNLCVCVCVCVCIAAALLGGNGLSGGAHGQGGARACRPQGMLTYADLC